MADILFSKQIEEANKAGSIREGVARMNALVTPCPPKQRSWRTLWIKPRQHHMEDMTHMLNTLTYTTLGRCSDCGLFVTGSGL